MKELPSGLEKRPGANWVEEPPSTLMRKVSQQPRPRVDILSKSQVEDEGPAAAAVKAETEASVSFQARRIQTTITINTASSSKSSLNSQGWVRYNQGRSDPWPPQQKPIGSRRCYMGLRFSIFFSVPPGLSAIIPPKIQTPSQREKGGCSCLRDTAFF